MQPLDQALAIGQEAIDQADGARGGGVEGGADGIGRHLLQLTGDDGGEQGLRPICSIRLGEMPVLPSGLGYAAPASFKPWHRALPPSVATRIEVISNAVETIDTCQEQPWWLFAKVTIGLLDPMTHQALITTAEAIKAAVDTQKQQRRMSFTGLGILVDAIGTGLVLAQHLAELFGAEAENLGGPAAGLSHQLCVGWVEWILRHVSSAPRPS